VGSGGFDGGGGGAELCAGEDEVGVRVEGSEGEMGESPGLIVRGGCCGVVAVDVGEEVGVGEGSVTEGVIGARGVERLGPIGGAGGKGEEKCKGERASHRVERNGKK
jgi:hypothetical protein